MTLTIDTRIEIRDLITTLNNFRINGNGLRPIESRTLILLKHILVEDEQK